MGIKPVLGAVSVLIGMLAYAIYIRQTTNKMNAILPHPFSWLLWGFVTTVAALAQDVSGAGPGNWVTMFTAAVCFIIAAVALLKKRWQFTVFDWISLATGLVVVLFYIFAKNPTASAVFATSADLLGYNSTIRKGWNDPYTDSVTSFGLNAAKFIPALLALNTYSIATWLYPATLVVVNGAVAVMLAWRRRPPRSQGFGRV
jgi:hypothetical protein